MARGAAGRPAASEKGAQRQPAASRAKSSTTQVTQPAGPGRPKRRRDLSDSQDSDVVLVYRAPQRRHHTLSTAASVPVATGLAPPRRGRAAAGATDTDSTPRAPLSGPQQHQQQQQQSSLSLQGASAAPQELMLCRRAVSTRNLVHSLQNCGLAPLPQAVQDVSSGAAESAPATGPSATQRDSLLVAALFAISEDRLLTAAHALLDIKGLVHYASSPAVPPDSGASSEAAAAVSARTAAPGPADEAKDTAAAQPMWWVDRAHVAAVVALAELCEAAVPTVLPSLVLTRDADEPWLAQDAIPQATRTGGAAVPAPVAMESVQHRLRCLARLRQLRGAYGNDSLAPAVRQCATVVQLSDMLLGSTASEHGACGVRSFPKSPAGQQGAAAAPRHRAEEMVLAELAAAASASCRIDADAWSTFAVQLPLRVVGGMYLLHPPSRRAALAELLREEADLYGLPPFLRSIRAADGDASSHFAAALGGRAGGSPSTGRAPAERRDEVLLLPSLSALDRGEFAAADAVQAPLVQEELVSLALKHCAFGLLVGEGDQILELVRQWGQHQSALAQRSLQLKEDESGVKLEGAAADADSSQQRDTTAPAQRGHRPCRDPLLPFARETAVRGRLSQGSESSSPPTAAAASASGGTRRRIVCDAQWLCSNKWATAEAGVSYYGLLYGVVLRNDLMASLDGATRGAPVVADAEPASTSGADSAHEARFSEVVYFPSAVVELSR